MRKGPIAFCILLACALLAFLPGCSLMSVRVPEKPLSQRELNVRVLMFDYAESFHESVTRAADAIAAGTSDPNIQLAALRWKIGAGSASRGAATQLAPMMALLDSWALAAQMHAFLRDGAGASLFGAQQPRARSTAEQLENDIIRLAGSVTTKQEFDAYQAFVGDYVRDSPLTSLDFQRASVVERWWSEQGRTPSLLSTVGTAPEVMSDFEGRLRLYDHALPAETLWEVQVALRENGHDVDDLRRALQQMDLSLADIDYVASESPKLLRDSLADLRGTLLITMDRLDRSMGEAMQSVRVERAALTESVAQERAAFASDVDVQRAAIARDAQRIADDAIETSARDLRRLVRELALYGFAAVILILGLPFAAGYLVGMARARRTP